VVDRVIQQATAQILSRGYERYFSEYSYGFRPNRDCHTAVRQALEYLNEGYEWVVDLDIEKYFDTVNHDKLVSIRTHGTGVFRRNGEKGDVVTLRPQVDVQLPRRLIDLLDRELAGNHPLEKQPAGVLLILLGLPMELGQVAPAGPLLLF